jgi:hypothetical protein
MFVSRALRISSAALKNINRQAHKVKHKPRTDALFPQYVNYYNVEDQVRRNIVIIFL